MTYKDLTFVLTNYGYISINDLLKNKTKYSLAYLDNSEVKYTKNFTIARKDENIYSYLVFNNAFYFSESTYFYLSNNTFSNLFNSTNKIQYTLKNPLSSGITLNKLNRHKLSDSSNKFLRIHDFKANSFDISLLDILSLCLYHARFGRFYKENENHYVVFDFYKYNFIFKQFISFLEYLKNKYNLDFYVSYKTSTVVIKSEELENIFLNKTSFYRSVLENNNLIDILKVILDSKVGFFDTDSPSQYSIIYVTIETIDFLSELCTLCGIDFSVSHMSKYYSRYIFTFFTKKQSINKNKIIKSKKQDTFFTIKLNKKYPIFLKQIQYLSSDSKEIEKFSFFAIESSE